jgi:hypothetical protein
MSALGPSLLANTLPSAGISLGPRLSVEVRLRPVTHLTLQGPETIRFALQVCGVVHWQPTFELMSETPSRRSM